MDDVEKFLLKWRKNNNTELAVYSSYHIDAMDAYAEQKVNEERESIKQILISYGNEILADKI